jgi:hypothetical protein
MRKGRFLEKCCPKLGYQFAKNACCFRNARFFHRNFVRLFKLFILCQQAWHHVPGGAEAAPHPPLLLRRQGPVGPVGERARRSLPVSRIRIRIDRGRGWGGGRLDSDPVAMKMIKMYK